MPKLPTYESSMAERGLQPSALGVESREATGRSISSAFHQIGGIVGDLVDVHEQHQEQQDISSLTNDYAQTFAGLTQSWNQTAAKSDPNDTATAEKWRDNILDPTLEKLGADTSSTGGQKKAAELRNELRMHFVQKTIGDQSTMGGVAVQSNLEGAGNALSQAAYADPSSFGASIKILNGLIDAQIGSHTLDAATGARIRENISGRLSKEIAVSAFRGMAERNAPAALEALDSGQFDRYFNGSEAKTLRSYAIEQTKLNNTLIEKQNKDDASTELSKIQGQTIAPDGSLTVPKTFYGDIAAWQGKWAGKPGTADMVTTQSRTLIDYGRALTRELSEGTPTVTDPHTYEDFRSRIALGSDDPNGVTDEQVIRARADGKLSDKDFTFFKGAVSTLAKDPALRVAQRDFNTFLKGIKSSITKSNILMGANDPAGDQRYLQFVQNAQAQFDSAYQKGDGSWKQLIDRNHGGSLWFQAKSYMTDQKGAMQNLQNSISGTPGLVPSVNAPARGKGESAADYLKRTGGQ